MNESTAIVKEAGLTLEQLHDLLVPPGFIKEKDFTAAVEIARHQEKSVEEVLVEKGQISNKQLGTLIAHFFDYKFVDLQSESVAPEVLQLIPESVARSQWVLAFGEDAEGVRVAMNNPANMEIRHLLEQSLGKRVLPYFATRRDLLATFFHYKQGLREEFAKILKKIEDKSLPDEERDAQTIVIVDKLLQYGYFSKTSDIHIEPREQIVVVRFRIDGILHDIIEMPKEIHNLILTRIKILSKMRTDEHMAAQDGKLRFIAVNGTEEPIDVRVSIVPAIYGETVVMRILSSQNKEFSLSDLGLNEENMQKVMKAIKHPHGMILVTGPTGSGKTTTLYAVLKLLNRREVNIATIEDPVEYSIEGVSQIQVNTKTNLTFAKGLRSIVRQDPNIIMVGEIRDAETADIAVNAALTGHLVLSTLHTNDAATTLPRLLDMDIEPFLVSSTVNVAIAQRLVRKICGRCRISYEITDKSKESSVAREIMTKYIKDKKRISDLRLYKGKGCPVCNFSGYIGRIGVFEVLEMTDAIQKMIIARASSEDLKNQAVKEGMKPMYEDGLEKVLAGITTIEEVLRVTAE